VSDYKYDTYIQVVDLKGNLIGENTKVNDSPQNWAPKPSVDVQSNGVVLVTFTGNDASGSGIFGKSFTPIQTPAPTSFPTSPFPTAFSTFAPTYLPTTDSPSSVPTMKPISDNHDNGLALGLPYIYLISGLSLLLCVCLCCCARHHSN